MTDATVLDVLGLAETDRDDVRMLLQDETHAVAARRARAALEERIGVFREESLDHLGIPPLAWLRAFVELTPTLVGLHRELGVAEDITRATFADVGRNVAIHRRTHGEFGFETWDWLLPHYCGMMFAIGRLNYALHRTELDAPGIRPGDWVVGLHIPEGDPLSEHLVDDSMARAKEFFARTFPQRAPRSAVCQTWLLDPFLQEHLPPESNIVRFARRFRPVGDLAYDDSEGLFFLFRQRDLHAILPVAHPTRLQRLVIERRQRGEPWATGTGVTEF